jgi:hypothetical protein
MFSLSLTAFAAFVSDGVSTRPVFLQKYDPCIRLCPNTDGRVGSIYNCMYRDGMDQTISTTAPLCNVGAAGSDTTGTLGYINTRVRSASAEDIMTRLCTKPKREGRRKLSRGNLRNGACRRVRARDVMLNLSGYWDYN